MYARAHRGRLSLRHLDAPINSDIQHYTHYSLFHLNIDIQSLLAINLQFVDKKKTKQLPTNMIAGLRIEHQNEAKTKRSSSSGASLSSRDNVREYQRRTCIDHRHKRNPSETIRGHPGPKAHTDSRQHLEALPRSRTVHHFGRRENLPTLLRALRKNHEVDWFDRQTGSIVRLRCRWNREAVQTRGSDALQSFHALSRQVQIGGQGQVLWRTARCRWSVSFDFLKLIVYVEYVSANWRVKVRGIGYGIIM